MHNEERISILLVDDHPVVRQGFQELLEKHPRFKVVGQASTGREALEFLKDNAVNIVLLDMEMPVVNGYEVLKVIRIRYTEAKVIVLSLHDHIEFIEECLNLGASACLGKTVDYKTLWKYIQLVHEGGMCYEPYIMKQLLELKNKRMTQLKGSQELSAQEKKVAIALSGGKTDKEVAGELHLSPSTVHFHRKNIYSKTGTKNVAELVLYCLRHKLINTYGRSNGVRGSDYGY